MKDTILTIIKNYSRDNVRIHASSAAFYIVVSALPLVAILIFSLTFLSPILLSELENFLKSILPKEFYRELYSIITGLKENRLPLLVPFSIITALWGSTKGIGAICYGVETVYKTTPKTNVILKWLKTAWRTLLFYLAIFGTLFIFAIGKFFPVQNLFVKITLNLRIIIFALLLSVFFTFFYSRLGNSPFKKHLLGGIISAVGWMAFTFFYSLYVSYALKSTSIYAEMGTIIFFMLWVYFCINIILVSAEINTLIS